MHQSMLSLFGCLLGASSFGCVPAPASPPPALAPHDLLISRGDGNELTVSVITRDGVTGASIVIDCEQRRAVAHGYHSDGKRTGRWERQNWKGTIVARESFLAGQRDGSCEYWDDDGALIAERSGIYKFDVLQK